MKTDRLNYFQIPVVMLMLLFLLLSTGAAVQPQQNKWVWHYDMVPTIPDIHNGLHDPYRDYGPHAAMPHIFIPVSNLKRAQNPEGIEWKNTH